MQEGSYMGIQELKLDDYIFNFLVNFGKYVINFDIY